MGNVITPGRAPVHHDHLVARSFADLTEDLEDLLAQTVLRMERLRRLRGQLGAGTVPGWVRREVIAGVDGRLAADEATCAELRSLLEPSAGEVALDELTRTKRRHAEVLRTRQALASSLFVAADWHSPSINHSVHSSAGRHEGRVVAHHSDYKRDRHPDQAAWEAAWLAEMVDHPGRDDLRVLLTASGMAAFTTILARVENLATDGPVLCGSGIYHECRDLLARSRLNDRIVFLAETDKRAWVEAAGLAPSAVFLDTLCNSAGLATPDVPWLLQTLGDQPRSPIFVLDNTARSVTFQPWTHLPPQSPAQMIVFESLTKFPQLGLDRAAGGVIVARGEDTEAIDALREHLGTNVADVVVYQHPWPDRGLLERRLARTGRNASVISEAMARTVDNQGLSLRVIHPGPSAPSGRAGPGFRGGFLAIESAGPDAIAIYRRIIEAALDIARARHVPICEGTSFGLDTTRIYLTAVTDDRATPFLRIAAGAEHMLGAHAVADALAAATLVAR